MRSRRKTQRKGGEMDAVGQNNTKVDSKPKRHGLGERADQMFGDLVGDRGEIDIPLDVVVGESEFLIKADLPGVKANDIELLAAGDKIELIAKRSRKRHVRSNGSRLTERSFGRMRRLIRLPGIRPGLARANLHNGVLTVRVPRTKASLGRIPVTEGSTQSGSNGSTGIETKTSRRRGDAKTRM